MMKIMKNQIRLSPYDSTKKFRLMIGGAKTVGTGFILIQYENDRNPEKGINIINAGSGLLADDKDYSEVEAGAIASHQAIAGCPHWIL